MGSVCIFQLGEITIGDLRVHKQIMLTDSQKKLSKQNLQPLKSRFFTGNLQRIDNKTHFRALKTIFMLGISVKDILTVEKNHNTEKNQTETLVLFTVKHDLIPVR